MQSNGIYESLKLDFFLELIKQERQKERYNNMILFK